MDSSIKMREVQTKDGSITFFSERFQENYHSLIGAETESLKKFIEPSGILTLKKAHVLDIGFGLGYNSMVLIQESRKRNQSLMIDCFEFDQSVLFSSLRFHSSANQEIIKALLDQGYFQDELIQVRIYWGDARRRIIEMQDNLADCVFLDPFSPPKNPELWTRQFIKHLKRVLNKNGKVLTYSSSLAVISAFSRNGFHVGYTPAVGRKRGGLMASKNFQDIVFPLSDADCYYLTVSSHSIPNIDKKEWNSERIKNYREKLTQFLKEKKCVLGHKKSLKIFEK